MDKTISIIAASVFGVGISAGVGLYVGNTYNAKSNVPAPTPVVTQAPVPVVVTPPRVNSVTVKGDNAKKYTVMRENIECWTSNSPYTQDITHRRMCDVDGVMTDLAGYSVHEGSIAICYESTDGGYSWEESWPSHWACKPVAELGAS